MTNKETAKKAMETLINCSNVMGSDKDVAEAISEALKGEHRTLQQAFFRSFVMAMGDYKNSRSDARNEASVKFAKVVSEGENYFPFI